MGVIQKISSISMRNKIIIGVVIILAVTAGYFTINGRSESSVTRAFSSMPSGTVDIVNDLGEVVTLKVSIAETNEARQSGFRGVGVQVINESAILYRYLRNTTLGHQADKVKAPLDMAFFNENGEILSIVQTEVGSNTRYNAGFLVQYKYILASGKGFMERNNISVNGGSRLLVESINK